MLVLDDCGPEEAADIVVSCTVAATAMQLQHQSMKLLGIRVFAKTMSTRVATTFDGIAQLVCLLT
jgi:hypothetical protein